MSAAGNGSLLSGTRLAGNVAWNFFGLALPLVGALVALPALLAGLGIERLGILSLAWLLIGYFNLFDLGVGRALTKLVADRLGDGRPQELAGLVWTALFLMIGCGVIGALALAALGPWLVRRVLEIPPALQDEATRVFLILALFIPVAVATTSVRGLLEALQRFRAASVVRALSGLFSYLGPVAVLAWSSSLVVVTFVLGVGRLAAAVTYLLLARAALPELRAPCRPNSEAAAALLKLGGWMTPTNLVTPLFAYLDRFCIGSLLSIAAVTYYAVPYEVVAKLLLIPAAVVGVLFPAFAHSLQRDREHAHRLFAVAVRCLLVLLAPAALVVVTLADESLGLWLGPEFARRSTGVLQWLTVGILCNCLAQVPFAFLQSAGRPDLTAKVNLGEFPVYVLLLFWAIETWGIVGAATLWAVRAGVDLAILLHLARRLLPGGPLVGHGWPIWAAALAAGLAGGVLSGGVWPTVLFLAVALPVFVVGGWKHVLGDPERRWLGQRLGVAQWLGVD